MGKITPKTVVEIKQPPSAEEKMFGRRVAQLRAAASLTDQQLADAIGLSHAAVRQIVSGGSVTQYLKLKKLADTLKVTPNDLFLSDKESPVSEFLHQDDVLAVLSVSYQFLGLDDHAASALARLVARLASARLAQTNRRDRDMVLAALSSLEVEQFLKSATPQK